MNACLSDFRVVNPTLRTFSAAEARIAQSSIRFNNLSAAELGYPESVRLLISSEGTTLAIQACDKDDPCAVPFMSGRTAEDLKGQKKWTTVSNRMLMHIIRTKLGWDSGKTPRRFYGVPWPEQYAILFDLTRAAPPRTRTPNLSVEDMLRTYELAASGTLMPVGDNTWAKTNKFASVPPSRVIEARTAWQFRRLTGEQLAEKIGIAVDSLRHIENGVRSPSFQLIERISDILDVSLDYLAGKTDSPLEHRVRKELENSGLTKEQEDAIVELALNSIPIIKKHI